jgi:hypothetical protein
MRRAGQVRWGGPGAEAHGAIAVPIGGPTRSWLLTLVTVPVAASLAEDAAGREFLILRGLHSTL